MRFLCGVITTALAINICESLPFKQGGPNPAYDFLTLSMNYRAGFCSNNSKCATAGDGFHSLWSIHGLWPSLNAGGGPSNCGSSPAFDINALKEIREQMNTFWPSYTDSNSEDFWKHEFDKHGSCAIVLKVKNVTDVATYFKTALNLNTGYNVTKYFEGINASNDAPVLLKNLTDVLNNNFKKRAQIHCEGQKNNEDILQEIRLCFDKDLQPSDCPVATTCKTEKVWYLKNGASSVAFSIVIVSLFALMALVNERSL